MNEVRHWSVRAIFTVAAVVGALLLLTGSSAHAGGACRGEPVTSGSDPVVHVNGVCFSPTMVHIKAGDTVTWTNDLSKAPHTVTGANGSWGSFDEIAPGGSFSHEFAADGIYPYYCFLHSGMVGAVIVGDAQRSPGGHESVSLASGVKPNQKIASSTSSGRGIGNVWLFVLLSGAAAMATATGGFALGTRHARR